VHSNGPWRSIGLWDVKDPTLPRQSVHRWRKVASLWVPVTELKLFLRNRAKPVHKAHNLTAIYEPIVYKIWDLNISQSYNPPLSVTAIALLFFCRWCSYSTGNTRGYLYFIILF
jgi:hypothetical protein